MQIFVTGGSGQTGPAIVTELVRAGHTVTGLARSDASAARIEALGATPVRGGLDDIEVLAAAAGAADGVVHMAFGNDFTDPGALARTDAAAVTAMGEALGDTGKPLVTTSGTLVTAANVVSLETDPPDESNHAAFRLIGERAALDLAERGVRSSVVRLAPTVHGPSDIGFIPALIAASRKAGAAIYIGDGANRWPAVNRLDAAVVYRLAVEGAPAGSVLHAVDESGITIRSIAETVGEQLGLPVRSVSVDEAVNYFASPFVAHAFALDAPASSALTREWLGWTPSHPGLLADLRDGDYFDGTNTARY